jgi:hypothetical protein
MALSRVSAALPFFGTLPTIGCALGHRHPPLTRLRSLFTALSAASGSLPLFGTLTVTGSLPLIGTLSPNDSLSLIGTLN